MFSGLSVCIQDNCNSCERIYTTTLQKMGAAQEKGDLDFSRDLASSLSS